MLSNVILGILVVIVPIMVIWSYREGIKTGMAVGKEKLPAFTPAEKKQEKNEFEKAVEIEEEQKKEQEKLKTDIEEVTSIENLYKYVEEEEKGDRRG